MATNESLILEWLEWFEHNQGRSAGSVNKYLAYLRNLASWLQKTRSKKLVDADKKDLEEYTGLEAHRSGMSPRSRRPLVAAIRGFYKWALDQWYVKENPAALLPYPTSGRRLPRPMSLENAEKLMMQPDLDEFIGVRDAAILSMFIGCGLRLSGMVALNESNLVFMNHEGQEWLLIRVVEKGNKERVIPAPHETRLLLRAYLGHPELSKIDRSLPDGDRVLWVSMANRSVPEHEYYGENRRLSHRSIGEMIEKYGDQAGIPRSECRPHALRHLYGTELTEDNVQQNKIQVLLGHSDPKSTGIYQHVAMRSLMKEVARSNPLAKMKTPVTELTKTLTNPIR